MDTKANKISIDKIGDKKNYNSNKLLTIINSPFVLWFLSTVVIGLVVFTYQKVDLDKKEEIENSLKMYNNSEEINFRYSIVDKTINEYIQEKDKLEKLISKRKVSGSEIYDFTKKAITIGASIKMMGIYSLPFQKKHNESGFLNLVSYASNYWRLSLEDLNLESGYENEDLKSISTYQLVIENKILDGKIRTSNIFEKTKEFKEIKNKLSNVTDLKDTSLTETLKNIYDKGDKLSPDNTKELIFTQKDFESINSWSEQIIIDWKKYKYYTYK